MTPCIEWKKSLFHDGYGQAYENGEHWRAHRLAWTKAHGPIPKGMMVLHTCDNRKCYNVDHLFLGTTTDNMRDMIRKGRRGIVKLTPDDVREIKAALGRGETGTSIAKRHGITFQQVSMIKLGKVWTRVQ